MRWVRYCLCYLLEVALLPLVLCLKGALALSLKLVGKNTNWKLRESLERMTISLDYKLNWLKQVLQNLPLSVVGSLLLWGLVLFAVACSCVPASHKQNFSALPTQPAKVEQSGCLGCCHTLQAKTQSHSVQGTWPIWGRQALWEF